MASDDQLGPQLRVRLTYLLKRALVDLEQLHAQHLAPLGISGRELAALLLLDAKEPGSQQQAAGRLGVDRTTMVGLIDGLESKGLVVRQADTEDRRRNVVVITEAGQLALRQAVVASDDAERRLLGGLDEQDAAQLRYLLRRVADGPS